MSTWTKICGITRPVDAVLAVQVGADALGFVMHARSPRRCDAEIARQIIEALPAHVTAVGVWFDESANAIAQEARQIGCRCIQNYDMVVAADLERRGFNVLPAVQSRTHLRAFRSQRFLIDMSRGGWSANAVRDAFAGPRGATKLVLAGGLAAENVSAALSEYEPDGVDVASGVESSPGLKDHQKLARFMKEIRQWDEKVTSARTAGGSCRKR